MTTQIVFSAVNIPANSSIYSSTIDLAQYDNSMLLLEFDQPHFVNIYRSDNNTERFLFQTYDTRQGKNVIIIPTFAFLLQLNWLTIEVFNTGLLSGTCNGRLILTALGE